jgi:hypothetical protein
MKTTLSTTEAAHRLINDNNANWSYAGAYALVEHLEELEEDIGDEIEFCECAIRCDYSEYSDLQEWGAEHWYLDSDMRDDLNLEVDDDPDDAIREFIQDHGTLLEFDGGIIVSSF